MEDLQAYRIENKYDVKAIESCVPGLYYFVDGSDKLVIAGKKGMTLLSGRQAIALAEEITDILSVRGEFS